MKKHKKERRPVGQILLEIEVLVMELFDDHQYQWGDWLWNQYGWCRIHRPDAQEEYLDGTHPEFHYGVPRDRKP